MKYYKVKKQYDNYQKNSDFDIFVQNELYTEKEFEKVKNEYIGNKDKLLKMFDIVEVSKRKIYWLFGARFEMEIQ